jgi:hypothetical protein
VGNAAGQITDRLHLLTLPQRVLGLRQFGRALIDALLKRLCELREAALRGLLILDVGIAPNPRFDLAGYILDGHGPRNMPAVDSVMPAQAEFGFVSLACLPRAGPS